MIYEEKVTQSGSTGKSGKTPVKKSGKTKASWYAIAWGRKIGITKSWAICRRHFRISR